MSFMDFVKDALERAGSSAGEQFLATIALMSALSLTGLPWKEALATSAGAFIVSILLTAAQYAVKANALPFWADVLVRGVKTFAASLAATLGSGVVDVLSVPWASAFDVAALAGFLAIIKSFLSPNAHMSGSLLSTPTAARVAKVQLSGNKFN